MVRGSTPATPSAWVITAACPSTPGAEKPTLPDPSLVTALPRMTARTVSPSASASDRRLSTTTPPPLPQIVPADRASNARQWPSGEVTPPSAYTYPQPGGRSIDAAPASAISHSPLRSASQARCAATREVEHAVCSVMLGPRRLSLYEVNVDR